MKHLFDWSQRTLHIAGLNQTAEQYEGYPEDSWEYEQWEGTQAAIAKVKDETGKVIRMEAFQPKDEIIEILDEKLVSCAMCSI